MAWTVMYDGLISGTNIIAVAGTTDATNICVIPYSNGQRVLLMDDGSA